MSGDTLRLVWDDDSGVDCVCVLVVPEKAVDEPGYIKGLHRSGAANKHEFHALAQTAYYQYQDDELEIVTVCSPVIITGPVDAEKLDAGLILFRDQNGSMKAVAHESVNVKKLLESANRFCTRWVRLDI